MRRVILLILALLTAGLFSPSGSQAQQGGRLCFNVPGITNCIEGRFRQFWEQNGGLANFGYPISPQAAHRVGEDTFVIQTFERARFELHAKNPRPYDVLMTRLGDERLKELGRIWQLLPRGKQQAGCLFFAETGHSICNQEGNFGFKSYWESNGLRETSLDPFRRALALFGLPLTEPTMERSASGVMVLTQWFERARFEFHPGNPRASRVLLGLLGNETQAALPPPGGACNGIPLAVDAVVASNCIRVGTSFTIEVSRFAPNQELNYWIIDEPGFVVGAVQTVRADGTGKASVTVDTRNFAGVALKPGNYVFLARDVDETTLPATAPFRLLP